MELGRAPSTRMALRPPHFSSVGFYSTFTNFLISFGLEQLQRCKTFSRVFTVHSCKPLVTANLRGQIWTLFVECRTSVQLSRVSEKARIESWLSSHPSFKFPNRKENPVSCRKGFSHYKFEVHSRLLRLLSQFDTIDRFHSRHQRPYWFNETKESICIKIEFNSCTPIWPSYLSFCTPTWPPWRHVKTICTPIERFHPCDYQPHWFTETNETICIKIECSS